MDIKTQYLSKSYGLGNSKIRALDNITLDIESGKFIVIAGTSGSGKSTLLGLLGCIEYPTHGSILIDGRDIVSMTSNQRAEFRSRQLGFVFQTFNLFPVLTAMENVEYPLYLQGKPKSQRTSRVKELLSAVGLERYMHHRPAQLSGGQRQRVAIARALAGNPSMILADEPTANLDHSTGTEIITLLKQLTEKRVTVLVATHDPAIITQCERVIELADGRLIKGA